MRSDECEDKNKHIERADTQTDKEEIVSVDKHKKTSPKIIF